MLMIRVVLGVEDLAPQKVKAVPPSGFLLPSPEPFVPTSYFALSAPCHHLSRLVCTFIELLQEAI